MQVSQALTDSEPFIKDWLMKRNCSVSPRQFVGFYVSLALVSIAIATSLFLTGAWLVLPFTGIELTVVGVAFVICARHAVDFERIRLYQNRLLIEQMNAEELTQFEFNSRWGAGRNGCDAEGATHDRIARSVGENRTTPCTTSLQALQAICCLVAGVAQTPEELASQHDA